MNVKVFTDTLWGLWAAADQWASGGKRIAFSRACPWGSALARSGGNRRRRLSINPQRICRFRHDGVARITLGTTSPWESIWRTVVTVPFEPEQLPEHNSHLQGWE
jgi:hypothetical protein